MYPCEVQSSQSSCYGWYFIFYENLTGAQGYIYSPLEHFLKFNFYFILECSWFTMLC